MLAGHAVTRKRTWEGGTPSQKALSRSAPGATVLVENGRFIHHPGTVRFALRLTGIGKLSTCFLFALVGELL